MAPPFLMLLNLYLSINAPFMSLSHAYASYCRNPHVPTSLTRTRSPTLPLDGDPDGETGQGTDSKKFTSIYV